MATESHTLTLNKLAQKSLNEKVIDKNITTLVASVNTKALANRGWNISANTDRAWRQRYTTTGDAQYRYEMYLVVTFNGKSDPEPHEFDRITRTIATRCTGPSYGRWMLAEVDEGPYAPMTVAVDGEITDDAVGYAPMEIPEEWGDYFGHLYGLDFQINRVKRALEGAELTAWERRESCVLFGPPGCGKSEVASSVKRALGEDVVWTLDGTQTTEAGAIKELAEREILPRVVIIEEIEKVDEKILRHLLGILDTRGEVRKVTARSTIVRDTKLIAIATVNDKDKFDTMLAGAVSSRFSNPVKFERPTRETLAAILRREVEKMNGNLGWIEPTLDFTEKHGITDPRRVISICICGRDGLLDGSFQKEYEATT